MGVSRQKNALNFGEDFFFGDHSILAEKRSEFASIQLKPNENSGQVRLRLNQTSKKAPPPFFAKSWLRDCFQPFKQL